LTRYHDELDTIEQIVEEQALGILNLQLNRFKEAVLPSPTELLSDVEHALPQYVAKISVSFLNFGGFLGIMAIYVLILCICVSFCGIYYFV
jgi:hypothetical protein